MDRRKFFRTSVLGSVGAFLAPLLPKSKILATITAGESRVISLAPVCDLCGKLGHKSKVVERFPLPFYGCGWDMGRGSGSPYVKVCETFPLTGWKETIGSRAMRIPLRVQIPRPDRPYPSGS